MLIETPVWCIASPSRVAKAFRHSVLTFLSVWVVNSGLLTESRDRSPVQVQDVHRAGPRAHHYHANHSRRDGDFFFFVLPFISFIRTHSTSSLSSLNWEQQFKHFWQAVMVCQSQGRRRMFQKQNVIERLEGVWRR